MSSELLGTYLAQVHLLAHCLLLLLTSLPLPRLPLLTFSSFVSLMHLAFCVLALLALSLLPFPLHTLLEFEREKFFQIAWRLSEFCIVKLPDVWER